MTRSDRGFTLIELLVVLLTIGTLISLVPAAFHRVLPGVEMKAAAREIAGLLREARSVAIRDNRDSAVIVDTEERVYRLEPGTRTHELSADIRLVLTTATSETIDETTGRIRFFPDGTSTGGRITLSRHERKLDIDVDWLTGQVRLAD